MTAPEKCSIPPNRCWPTSVSTASHNRSYRPILPASDPASMNGRPCASGRGRPAALVLPRRCRRRALPTPRRSHWPSACHPLALPVAIISPVAPRTVTCGPPAGRTTSPGSCLAVPPARPGRRVGALSVHCTPRRGLASARIVLSPAGPAGGSSPVRRRCSGGGRGRFPARRRWRVPPGRAGRRVRRRGHLQRDASPGRQEQQGQREAGPYRRCYGLSPSRRACGGAL